MTASASVPELPLCGAFIGLVYFSWIPFGPHGFVLWLLTGLAALERSIAAKDEEGL